MHCTKPFCIEYVWLGGNNELRSKTRVLLPGCAFALNSIVEMLPEWNYDGSSTYQADGVDSEVIIKPRALFKDPFRGNPSYNFMVLCDTYKPDGTPLTNNHRVKAVELFNQKVEEEPWFGIEQEYYLYDNDTNKPLGFPINGLPLRAQGPYYCAVGSNNVFGRDIVDKHLEYCIEAGIKISGINAEVAPGQWEFQIGPCIGIEEGDHLMMARYILERLTEQYNVYINYDPKPLEGDWNGSGCHTNYSTKNMREGTSEKKGIEYINEAVDKLSLKHDEHMKVYGSGNEKRMTGKHETADYNSFTSGIANRGASVRIGNANYKNEKGYFEDRRPSSNCDPYLVTSKIFETTVLNE